MEAIPLQYIMMHALAYGALLSAVLFTMILGLVRVNPEIMLNDYPPDIKTKYGPMSERTRRQRIPVAILVIVVLIWIVAASLRGLRAGGDISFLPAFVHLAVMFTVFNVLDWLVLDWLIVVTIRPRFIILPGTEGMPGYSDYGFHFRGFLIGTVITLVTSLLAAAAVAALF